MNREQLDEIHARAEAATKGPWLADGTILNVNTADGRALVRLAYVLLGDDDTRENYPQATADGEFIAHARRDVPALLDEIERLNKRIDKAHDDLTRIDDGDTDEFTTFESTVAYVVLRYRALEKDFNELDEMHHGPGVTVVACSHAEGIAEGDQSKGSSTGGVS